MNKKIVVAILLLCVVLSMGCLEEEERTYNHIWYSCVINVHVYDYNDNHIGYYTITERDTVPYTDYDWYGNIDLEDYLDGMEGITNVKTIKDEISYPADNKLSNTFKVIVYAKDGYLVMDGYVTGTRY